MLSRRLLVFGAFAVVSALQQNHTRTQLHRSSNVAAAHGGHRAFTPTHTYNGSALEVGDHSRGRRVKTNHV